MSRRRIAFCLLALVLVALVVGSLLIRHVWQDILRANGIRQLDWQGVGISMTGLDIRQLSVLQVQSDRQIGAELYGVSLDWTWSWTGPQLGALVMDQLELDVQDRPESETPTENTPLKALPDRAPNWLPRRLTVKSFTAVLPCEIGHCPLSGSFLATRQQSLLPLAAKLELEHEGHRVRVQGRLSEGGPDRYDLAAELAIDGETHLTVQSAYQVDTEDRTARWTGTADMMRLPRTQWLLAWLRQWQVMPVSPPPTQPEAGNLSVHWHLHGPQDEDFLRQVSGSLTVKARLPQPWPIPGIAAIAGNLELTLAAEQGEWLARTAQADLHLSKLAGWVRQVPETLRLDSLAIKIRPVSSEYSAPEDARLLPLRMTLAGRGASRIDMDAHLALATSAPWVMQLSEASVAFQVPEFDATDWLLRGLRANLRVRGRADTETVTLDFDRNSTVQLDHIGNSGAETAIELEGLDIDLHRLQLAAGYSQQEGSFEYIRLQGPIESSAEKVRHPLLHPQSWDFRGELQADLGHLHLNGELAAEAGAAVDLRLHYVPGGALVTEAQGRFSGESGGRALAETLAVWPPSMTLTGGSLDVAASLRLPDGGDPEVEARLEFDELSGLYDRTALTGLDGTLDITLEEAWFAVDAPRLKLEQANAGIPVGPVFMAGHYEAPLEKPLDGQLEVQKAVAGLFGGEIRIEPNVWKLSDPPLGATLELDKLELSQLLAQYPAEGLSGTGTLSGRMPMTIGSSGGIVVEQGSVAAGEPGGVLKFPAERLRAMGQGNPTMELVAEALEDFHYSVLSSTIDYDQEGTLQLGLHAEGSNPAVGEGQPIVLNINLEENMPALLTSLQLSGRVNDAITEKVKALIRERQAQSGNKSGTESGIKNKAKSDANPESLN